jgi:hypothetical protein
LIEIATVHAGKTMQEEFRGNFPIFTHTIATTILGAEVASDQQPADRRVFVVVKNANKTYVPFAFSQTEKYLAEFVDKMDSIAIQYFRENDGCRFGKA